MDRPTTMLIMFKTKDCHECKASIPELVEVASQIDFVVGVVDCVKYERLCEVWVQGEYNLVFIKDKHLFAYGEAYTALDILNWVKNPQP